MALYEKGKKVHQTNLNPSTAVDDTKALNDALVEEFKEQGLSLESKEPKVKDYKKAYPTVDALSLRTAWSEYTVGLQAAINDEADKD